MKRNIIRTKPMVLVMVFAICLLININVYAEQNIQADSELDCLDGINQDDYNEANQAYVDFGIPLVRAKAAGSIQNVPHYFQDAGNSWDNDLMLTENLTIAGSGCCVTSFSMVLSYLKGTNYNPGQVNLLLGNDACPFYWEDAADDCGVRLDSIVRQTVTQSYVSEYVAGAISQGYPVIIGLTNGSSTHFVVGHAYSGTSVHIYDPGKKNNYPTLSRYYDAGYSVYRLAVYK